MIKGKSLAPVCLTGLAAASLSCDNEAKFSNPNVIIILADDMGWGDVNANGIQLVETHVLSHLNSESQSFDRFQVCPLSAPTRAEILTSRYFMRTGASSVTRGYENKKGIILRVRQLNLWNETGRTIFYVKYHFEFLIRLTMRFEATNN